MAKRVIIPADGLVVFWVNTEIRNNVEQLHGTKVFLMACHSHDLYRLMEKVHRYKIIFSDDPEEALAFAQDCADRELAKQKLLMRPTVYMQINPAAA